MSCHIFSFLSLNVMALDRFPESWGKASLIIKVMSKFITTGLVNLSVSNVVDKVISLQKKIISNKKMVWSDSF